MSRPADHTYYEAAMAAFARKDFSGAAARVRKALKAQPKDAEIRHNLAGALIQAGDIGQGLALLTQALALRPDQRVSAEMLSAQLKRVSPSDVATLDPKGLAAALRTSEVDPQPLVRTAIAWLVQAGPAQGGLAGILDIGRREGWTDAAAALLDGPGRRAVSNALFLAALGRGVNVDLEVEHLLTAARRHLLLAPDAIDLDDERQAAFLVALITQAHNNEHVWPTTDEETGRLLAVMVERSAIEAGDPVAARALALWGLYEVFDRMPSLAEGPLEFDALRPSALADLVREIVESRRSERTLGAALPSLGASDDAVSAAVAGQYEANPYPRWLAFRPPAPGSMCRQLAAFLPAGGLGRLERPFQVLIAGCGTGREAAEAAFGFAPRGRVLAIDLSRASLGYAARMARRYAAPNLELAQGDILGLSEPGPFAVIICSGVLHHMADPPAGWKVLRDKLEPGGLMRVGLYSRLARADIARVRAMLGDEPPRTPEAVRSLRARLIGEHWDDLGERNRRAADFFSTSGCRDLFFHEQEHHFTIPELRGMLAELGLAFRGFILPNLIRERFRRWAAPGAAATDLAAWWDYEQAHPQTFSGMYQFWCQRQHEAFGA